jgi:hypothetical protein
MYGLLNATTISTDRDITHPCAANGGIAIDGEGWHDKPRVKYDGVLTIHQRDHGASHPDTMETMNFEQPAEDQHRIVGLASTIQYTARIYCTRVHRYYHSLTLTLTPLPPSMTLPSLSDMQMDQQQHNDAPALV